MLGSTDNNKEVKVFRLKNILFLFLFLVGSGLTVSCGGPALFDRSGEEPSPGIVTPVPPEIILENVVFEVASLAMAVNQTGRPILHVYFSNGAHYKNVAAELDTQYTDEPLEVIWETSDETVAGVDETGYVTALTPGTAIITAIMDEMTTDVEITVTF